MAKKETRIEACMRLEAEGKTVEQIAAELKIKERNVKAYLWRGHHPEEFKAMLEKYYQKRKARKAEKKPKAAKKKKPAAKKPKKAEAEEIVEEAAEEPEAVESTTEEKNVENQSTAPVNPWAK